MGCRPRLGFGGRLCSLRRRGPRVGMNGGRHRPPLAHTLAPFPAGLVPFSACEAFPRSPSCVPHSDASLGALTAADRAGPCALLAPRGGLWTVRGVTAGLDKLADMSLHGLLVLCRKKSPASSLVSRGCVHHSAVALLILTDAFSSASVLCDIHEALQMLKKKSSSIC